MTDPVRVVVSGVGATSPLGCTAREVWERLCEGRSSVRNLSRWRESGLPSTLGGEVDSIPPETRFRDRVLAQTAIDQAVDQAGIETERVGIVWGAGLDTYIAGSSGPEFRPAGRLFAELARNFDTPRRMIATACASGTHAVGEAFQLVRAGRADRIVSGGSSVMLHPLYLAGFASLQALVLDSDLNGYVPATACRPFDRKRRGLVLADGAGALVVESLDSADARAVEPLAEVIGYGVSQDAYDLNRPPEDGTGAELAMRRALTDAKSAPSELDAVHAHGTGTFAGDRAEASAIRRLFGDAWRDKPVHGMKGAMGHSMAAAGAIEAVVSVRSVATGIVPPTTNLTEPDEGCELDHVIAEPRRADVSTVLSVSFGMGGQNAGIVLRRWRP